MIRRIMGRKKGTGHWVKFLREMKHGDFLIFHEENELKSFRRAAKDFGFKVFSERTESPNETIGRIYDPKHFKPGPK